MVTIFKAPTVNVYHVVEKQPHPLDEVDDGTACAIIVVVYGVLLLLVFLLAYILDKISGASSVRSYQRLDDSSDKLRTESEKTVYVNRF